MAVSYSKPALVHKLSVILTALKNEVENIQTAGYNGARGDVPYSLIVQFIVYAIINPLINHCLSFCSSFNQSQDNLIIKIAELICDWLKDEQNIEERFISGRHLAVY